MPRQKRTMERPEPELIKVRATSRGYYAIKEIITTRDVDGTKYQELNRNNVIRNEGEVFEYDLNDSPLVSSLDARKQQEIADGNRETAKSSRGEVALPRWVTVAAARERATEAAGHTKTFGNMGGAKEPQHVI